MPTRTLHYELEAPRASLINKVVDKLNYLCNEVWIRQLRRYGHSGSELFVIRAPDGRPQSSDDARRYVPVVVKIGPRGSIAREQVGYQLITNRVEAVGFAPTKAQFLDDHDLGAIVYPLHSEMRGKSDPKIRELRELFFRSDTPPEEATLGIQTLQELYEGLERESFHSPLEIKESTWREQFNTSLSDDGINKAKARIRRMLGRRGEFAIPYNLHAADPLDLIDRVLQAKSNFMVGSIHGDLHSSNVLLRHGKFPGLIDFEWSSPEGYLARDFVSMECSLRFHHFPSDISLPDQLEMISILNCFEGYEHSSPELEAHPEYREVSEATRIIRQSARRAFGIKALEYTTALFVDLFRNMQYPQFGHLPLAALCNLAHLIQNDLDIGRSS